MSIPQNDLPKNRKELADAILNGSGILEKPFSRLSMQKMSNDYSSILLKPRKSPKFVQPNPYDFQDTLIDSDSVEPKSPDYNKDCPLTLEEKRIFINTFKGWTGIDYDDHTEDEMVHELNNVRAFLKNDMARLLGMSGIMTDIHQCMFMNELEKFDEDDLMAYAILFHIDMSVLETLQDFMEETYSSYLLTTELSEQELQDLQNSNTKKYVHTLRLLIIDHKIWMMDRLRRWKWIDEVLFNRAGNNFSEYPGLPIVESFDYTSRILSDGINAYHMRVGEIKRETLIDTYKFFDLYHMAGMLSSVFSSDVEFTTDMDIFDLADLIILMLDELSIDPRNVITPLGIYVIYNSEEGEVVLNMHKNVIHEPEDLYLSASHAGIEISVNSNGVLDDGTTAKKRDVKPQYVVLEELTVQYMSPQFYSGIEAHRDWMSVVKTFKTLDGQHIMEFEEGDLIFYGVGDGISSYRIFTPKELGDIFIMTKDFYDPYSVRQNPEDSEKWSRFSIQSIKRLLLLVIPKLRKKSKSRNSQEYDALEKIIIEILDISDGTLGKSEQAKIVQYLKENIEDIREPLGEFLAYLMNFGIQLSDWSVDMIQIDPNAIHVGILSDPYWKYTDPETTVNLTDKLFKMIVPETENYINVIGKEGDNYSKMIKALKLVKYHGDAYRIDWDNELSTIGGYLYTMIEASNLSYYKYLKTVGNWFIVTSSYYSELLLGIQPVDISSPLYE